MQLYNQIKGIFFLSIFMMLMLHNLLPHVHHQLHENSQATLTQHDHSHGHSHHHPEHHPAQEEEEEAGGILSLLLGSHSGFTFHQHDVPVLKKPGQSEIKTQHQLAVFKPDCFCFLMYNYWEGENQFGPYRYRFKSAPPIYNLSLRAPPTLG